MFDDNKTAGNHVKARWPAYTTRPSAVATIARPLLPGNVSSLYCPFEAPKFSITLLTSVGQRHAEIGALVDVLLAFGSVVLPLVPSYRRQTTVPAGLLFGNIC